MESILNDFTDYLEKNDWAESTSVVVLGLAIALLAFFVVRTVLIPIVHRAASRSAIHWDDIMLDRPVLNAVSLFAPLIVISIFVGLVPHWAGETTDIARRVSNASFLVAGLLAISTMLSALNRAYNTLEVARDRPITAYIQLAKIFVWVLGFAFIVAVLARQSPWFFISGLGALMAVLLLVFRDTILSFVASIQLAQNDMVRVGDWIEMPQKGADGDVIDIALHTVKVQNFDKTIVTIPTHALVTESFRNWRGMSESGARRIMRSIAIDTASVRFLNDAEIEELRNFEPIANYMERKLTEIAEQAVSSPDSVIPDRRRLTNIGTFRAYVFAYLRNHPRIDSEHQTLLVRQLPPGPTGVPIEVYAFANTTVWAEYEAIQADIFDHLLAIVPRFGLTVFQEPTGKDFASLGTPGPRAAVDFRTIDVR